MDRRLRLLRRLPRSPISDAVSQSYHNFLSGAKVDADGSVYRETIVRMPSASTAPKPKPWETTLAGRRTSLGAPSLLLCVRKMLTELLCDLSVEALQALPWRLGRMIWEDAEATRRGSFEVWAMFREAYKDEPEADILTLRRYALSESSPLIPAIPRISSPNFAFLVMLDLRAATHLSRDDFTDITHIPNLCSIHITDTQEIDDMVVRAWSRSAVHTRKLSRLWYISIHNCSTVTPRSLEYILNITSVRIVDFRGCEKISRPSVGWIQDGTIVPLERSRTVDDCLRAILTQFYGKVDAAPRLYVSWDGIMRASTTTWKTHGTVYRRDPNFRAAPKRVASSIGESKGRGNDKNLHSESAPKRRAIRAKFKKEFKNNTASAMSNFWNPGPKR